MSEPSDIQLKETFCDPSFQFRWTARMPAAKSFFRAQCQMRNLCQFNLTWIFSRWKMKLSFASVELFGTSGSVKPYYFPGSDSQQTNKTS